MEPSISPLKRPHKLSKETDSHLIVKGLGKSIYFYYQANIIVVCFPPPCHTVYHQVTAFISNNNKTYTLTSHTLNPFSHTYLKHGQITGIKEITILNIFSSSIPSIFLVYRVIIMKLTRSPYLYELLLLLL